LTKRIHFFFFFASNSKTHIIHFRVEFNIIFIGETDITKKKYTNKYVRNVVHLLQSFFWCSMGDLNWEKANTTV